MKVHNKCLGTPVFKNSATSLFEMQSLDFLYKYAVWHSASMHGGGYNMIHETQERDITLVCL